MHRDAELRSYESRLVTLIETNDRVMGLLRAVRSLGLDVWCIAAGTIRNLVWDHLHERDEPTLPSDIDVLIFDDQQTDPDYEKDLEQQLAQLVAGVQWEVVNQATINTYTGDPNPYTSIEDAMSRWADPVTAVGVHLAADDQISIIAPGGLTDLFELRVRPNLQTPTAAGVYRQRMASKGWTEQWPKLTIEDLGDLPGAASQITHAPLPELVDSGNLVIRRWSAGDATKMADLIGESLDHLRPWMAWAILEPLPTAQRLRLFRRWDRYWASGLGVVYAIEVEHELVGGCSLHRRVGPGGIDLGYWLGQRGTGRGLATRTATALTEAAFELDDVDFVQISHTTSNSRSAAVAQRLGYTKLAPPVSRDVTTWQRQRGA